MGFPGTVKATCTYSILETDGQEALQVAFAATTDAPTLTNFGHHSYSCLDDSLDVRKHHLRIDADHYLPCDETVVPTGDVAMVDGTGFDFRTSRPVEGAFDHNFCFAGLRRDLAPMAQLSSQKSRLSMQVSTTEPGLQLYTGQGLTGGGLSHGGHGNGPFAGICLEPQSWPNAPNKASFQSIDLAPGERYQQVSEFAFSQS